MLGRPLVNVVGAMGEDDKTSRLHDAAELLHAAALGLNVGQHAHDYDRVELVRPVLQRLAEVADLRHLVDALLPGELHAPGREVHAGDVLEALPRERLARKPVAGTRVEDAKALLRPRGGVLLEGPGNDLGHVVAPVAHVLVVVTAPVVVELLGVLVGCGEALHHACRRVRRHGANPRAQEPRRASAHARPERAREGTRWT
mmetsp:Transcript_101412/g.316162  ORF Transcript_101412/g.316162 Transcript_101412/m.316162 type:complete len:201 (+) Transcript_101412:420-1022(+)